MQFKIFDLGLVDFEKAYQTQKEIFENVRSGIFASALILCRHYPVITLGRSADRRNILACESVLLDKGIKIYEIDRGGDVTYHGPGQLILYPILNLNFYKKDLHLALRNLESIVIRTLVEFGVTANRLTGSTGVWLGNKKIASIGIAVKNWITYHGAAINIKNNDLDNFSLIRPCGMDIMMTSLESFLGKEVKFSDVKKNITRRWEDGQSYFA